MAFVEDGRDEPAKKRQTLLPRLLVAILLAAFLGKVWGAFTPWQEQVVTVAQKADGRPFNLLLVDTFGTRELMPVDLQTLADRPAVVVPEPGLFSADRSTAVSLEYPEGRGSQDPQDIWIVVHDLNSGNERGRFHPPVKGVVSALSADGNRLLLSPGPASHSTYPPIAEWYVLDANGGEVSAHIIDESGACFRQWALFDSDGKTIYCLVDPALDGHGDAVPIGVVAYDVESGSRTADIALPDTLIGSKHIDKGEQKQATLFEPALVLTPSGEHLALVHATDDRITMLSTPDLTVEQTFSLLSAADSEVDAGKMAEKPSLSGNIRQAVFSADGRYLYVFSQDGRIPPDKTSPIEGGLLRVDLEQETLTAEALSEHRIQWVIPAPDGTVFVFGTSDTGLGPYEIRPDSPSSLWRLDGATLDILAERVFDGYRGGRLGPDLTPSN